MNDQPEIVTVIVTYNGEKWIKKCLESVIKISFPIIVDNGSNDGTVEYVRSLGPQIKLLQMDSNMGFGAANNFGIQEAIKMNAMYILLLNQDAWIKEGELSGLRNLFFSNKNLAIVSPIHLTGNALDFDYGFYEYIEPTRCPNFLCDLSIGKIKSHYPIKFINAAAWFVPSEIFKKFGGFHSAFFHYGEDNEFINRIRRAGFYVAITPSVIICHDRPQLLARNKYFTKLERMKRRYLIELYEEENHQLKYLVLRKSLIKSALYHFIRGSVTSALNYLKVIRFLKSNLGYSGPTFVG